MLSRTAFAAVVLLSFFMLFAPGSSVPTGIPISDKVIHFLLFAALATTGRRAGAPLGVLAPGLVAYAGFSELLQTLLPIDRDGDWRDALADILGAFAGLAVAWLAIRPDRRVAS